MDLWICWSWTPPSLTPQGNDGGSTQGGGGGGGAGGAGSDGPNGAGGAGSPIAIETNSKNLCWWWIWWWCKHLLIMVVQYWRWWEMLTLIMLDWWWFWNCCSSLSNCIKLDGTAKATGGSISFYGGKTIHTFTSSGTFHNPTALTD